ncbi:MAG: NADP oxidoreductase [Candidatus Nanopelagicales bacterium]|nr:NADP oxidoreductase [Candidatus Nanopelagicales bacterium]
MARPLRVAVVGSGPSGMYAADALISQQDLPVTVDVIDKLPVPFGLVRYGVAPDHVSIRSVRDTLDKVFEKPGVRFIGGLEVGVDISVQTLHEFFDAIMFTYGASRDRRLGVPGEDLDGSVAATDFVAWYCGHPDADRATFERLIPTATSAVVVGVGNVAVDVTRVLAKTVDELTHTDMPEYVLDTLRKSLLTDIHVLGRRGPAQATYTTKELRELGELLDADIVVERADLVFDAGSEQAIANDKSIARNVEVVKEWATRRTTGKSRRIHLHFMSRPVELRGDDRVREVVVERTELDGAGGAKGTGETFVIKADLVVRSVGYRGMALPGVPFDEGQSVIPHLDGRVQLGGAPVSGQYVAGWIKRGPTGIIGTNKKDATATVAALLADANNLPAAPLPSPADFDTWLLQSGITVVDSAGWQLIDAAERALGESKGRERTTIQTTEDLLNAANAIVS